MKLLRDQKGMALLLVLVIVALLSALLTEFSFSTLVDLRATETFRDRTQAYYLARGGVEAALMILQQDTNNWDHPSEFWGDLPTVPVGDGDVSLKIEDLTGRFNLNTVGDSNGNPGIFGYHRFLVLCDEVLRSTPAEAKDMADALVNWFNTNRTQVTDDDSYYARQQPPYSRGGEKLKTVDELLMVRYFDEEKVNALKKYVRVVGDITNPIININTASDKVLYAWQFTSSASEENLDHQSIDTLIDYRQQTPFTARNDLGLVPGINLNWGLALPPNSALVKGKYFQVTSNGRINDVTRQVVATIAKNGNTCNILSLKVE